MGQYEDPLRSTSTDIRELNCLTAEENKEEENDLPCNEFDDILDIIGSQGRVQKLLLYAAICPITAIEPFITLNMIFLLFQPEHWCYVHGRDPNITSLTDWKNFYIPLDYTRPPGSDGQPKFSQCTMYSEDSSIIKCPSGWEYDNTEYESTISSAYNWVCDSADNPTDAFTAQAFGNAVGTLVLGHLSDKVGRKPIFFLTILINVVFRMLSFFVVHNIVMFNITQFIAGTAFPMMFIAPSMILAEICDKDYRGHVYAMTWMIWVVGMAALPLVVWFCREWFLIGITTTIPGALLFLYWFYLPESPRWLFSVGKLEDAACVLMKIAKSNDRADRLTKRQLDGTLSRLYSLQAKSEGRTGVWTLFSRMRLAKNTVLLTVCWSINIVVYYGITLNTTQMSGNQFVNFFMLSIIELPSGMCGAYLVDRVGRRWTQVIFFCGCTLACAASAAIVQFLNNPVIEIISVVVAKFAITLTFLVVYLQGAEIFPTQLRSTGSGFASTVGAACGILGPIMVALGTYNVSYPYWIMASLCFVGMISAAFLPETLNQTLPETIDDANKFGKGNRFWSLRPSIDLTKENSKDKPRLSQDNLKHCEKLTGNHINN
ncbi:organic cation transporter 1 [Folsomia candida]|uniref:Organic cation transporter 1 n=1 Tax=Folsomia candida TaxID=158441 RepID=A0A226E213_FOLCA|nr:organic cation transporter 1 [Folsomia candida]OXA51603.1 Organic cation transporter 1 [Folsomia candida]